jgi:heat shock protein HslJ
MRTSIAFTLLLLIAACAPLPDANHPDTAASLEGTSWTVTAIRGDAPIAGSNLTLQFAGGSATGNGGCNQYRAPFTTSGSTLTFGPALSTNRACAEAARNSQETAYLDALSRVTAYEISGDRLILRNTGNGTLLELARQQ